MKMSYNGLSMLKMKEEKSTNLSPALLFHVWHKPQSFLHTKSTFANAVSEAVTVGILLHAAEYNHTQEGT